MTVAIEYEKILKKTSTELVNQIKKDADIILFGPHAKIEKVSIQECENYVLIGFTTMGLIYVYRYRKRDKEFTVKRLSIADYWFIGDMLEGGK